MNLIRRKATHQSMSIAEIRISYNWFCCLCQLNYFQLQPLPTSVTSSRLFNGFYSCRSLPDYPLPTSRTISTLPSSSYYMLHFDDKKFLNFITFIQTCHSNSMYCLTLLSDNFLCKFRTDWMNFGAINFGRQFWKKTEPKT